ncbi:DNA cytosine methyltransferase, partial [Streptomyces beijiangensis]|nr:DNA cytosine methyltransferase [Streptomyces beijiangensis]
PPPLLVPYYGTGQAKPTNHPMGTLTTRDRHALVMAQAGQPAEPIAVDDCLLRMLNPSEIARGMAFRYGYVLLGTRREQVRQLGNAVTPPAAEVLIALLTE